MDPGGEVVDDRRVHHAAHSERCELRPHLGDPMRIKDFRKGLQKSDREDCIAERSPWLKKMFPEAYLAPIGV